MEQNSNQMKQEEIWFLCRCTKWRHTRVCKDPIDKWMKDQHDGCYHLKKSWQSSCTTHNRMRSRAHKKAYTKKSTGKQQQNSDEENEIARQHREYHKLKEKVNFPTHSTSHTGCSVKCLGTKWLNARCDGVYFFRLLHAQYVHEVDKHTNVYIMCAKFSYTFVTMILLYYGFYLYIHISVNILYIWGIFWIFYRYH